MSVGMRAGQLRHRVTVEERVEGYDDAGQPVEEWSKVADAWAAIEPLDGRRLFSAREAGLEATHEVRVRYRDALRDGSRWRIDRIRYGDRTFVPDGPPRNTGERGVEVVIPAVERTDE